MAACGVACGEAAYVWGYVLLKHTRTSTAKKGCTTCNSSQRGSDWRPPHARTNISNTAYLVFHNSGRIIDSFWSSRFNVWYSMYVPFSVHRSAEQNVFPQCPRLNPGLLRGVGQASLNRHVARAFALQAHHGRWETKGKQPRKTSISKVPKNQEELIYSPPPPLQGSGAGKPQVTGESNKTGLPCLLTLQDGGTHRSADLDTRKVAAVAAGTAECKGPSSSTPLSSFNPSYARASCRVD